MRTREEASEMTERSLACAALCSVVLRDEEPQVQGAALAEMMRMFLMGHRIPNDPRFEREMRDAVFEQWIDTVRKLLLIYDKPPVGTQ
jgi:hypothetical protein